MTWWCHLGLAVAIGIPVALALIVAVGRESHERPGYIDLTGRPYITAGEMEKLRRRLREDAAWREKRGQPGCELRARGRDR